VTLAPVTSVKTIFDFHSVFHNLTAFRSAPNPSQTTCILGLLKGFQCARVLEHSQKMPDFKSLLGSGSDVSGLIFRRRATDSGNSASIAMIESRTSECNTRPRE